MAPGAERRVRIIGGGTPRMDACGPLLACAPLVGAHGIFRHRPGWTSALRSWALLERPPPQRCAPLRDVTRSCAFLRRCAPLRLCASARLSWADARDARDARNARDARDALNTRDNRDTRDARGPRRCAGRRTSWTDARVTCRCFAGGPPGRTRGRLLCAVPVRCRSLARRLVCVLVRCCLLLPSLSRPCSPGLLRPRWSGCCALDSPLVARYRGHIVAAAAQS